MISLLLVSHEIRIVTGLKALILEMSPNVDVQISGGTADGGIGTDAMDILAKIEAAQGDDILLFFDIGSSFLSSKMALDFYSGSKKIHFLDAPLVEGAFIASVNIMAEQSLEDIFEELKPMCLHKMPQI